MPADMIAWEQMPDVGKELWPGLAAGSLAERNGKDTDDIEIKECHPFPRHLPTLLTGCGTKSEWHINYT